VFWNLVKTFFRYVWLSAVAIFFACLIFIGWLHVKLETTARKAFGAEVQYESFSWEKNAIILSNLTLKGLHLSKDLNYHVDFDYVKIDYLLEFSERQITFDLYFHNPNVSISKLAENVSPWEYAQEKFEQEFVRLRNKKQPFFNISVNAVMGQGLMELTDDKKNDLIATPPLHLIYQGWEAKDLSPLGLSRFFGQSFSRMHHFFDRTPFVGIGSTIPWTLEASSGTSPYSSSFDSKERSSREGIAVYLENRQGQVFKKMTFLGVECQDVVKLAEFLAGPIFHPWKWHHGTLKGQFDYIDSDKNFSYIEGEGIIHDARIDHAKSGMGGYFKELKIKLSKREGAEPPLSWQPNNHFEAIRFHTKGEVELTEPASFFRNLDRASQWILKDILGNIHLGDETSSEKLDWFFEGALTTYEEPDAKFELQGSFPMDLKSGQQGRISVRRNCQDRESISTELLITAIDDAEQDFELTIENWGPQEFDVVRHLCPDLDFFEDKLHIRKGTLSAKVKARLQEGPSISTFPLNSVSISEINARNLDLSWNVSEFQGRLEKLTGWMDLSLLKEDEEWKVNLVGSELIFAEGEVHRELGMSQNDPLFAIDDVSHLSGNMSFSEGVLQKAGISGNLGGLSTSLLFHGLDAEKIATVRVDGCISDFLLRLPYEWVKEIKQGLPNDKCSINGELIKNASGLLALGHFHIEDPAGNQYEGEISADFKRNAPENLENLHSEKKWLGISLAEASGPPKEAIQSSCVMIVDWLEDANGIWGINFDQGRFKVSQFPIERYASATLFSDQSVAMRGIAKLNGQFNSTSLSLDLDALDTIIEGPFYHIHIQEIGSFSESVDGPKVAPASLLFDFSTKSFQGTIPLVNASYLEKKNDLLFTDIHGSLWFEDGQILIPDLKAASDEIFFDGALELDFSNPDATHLIIETKQIDASIPSAMAFGSRFNNKFLNSRLQGRFVNGKNDFFLHLTIPKAPEKENIVDWKLRGQLKEGSYIFPQARTTLNRLCADFDYQSSKDLLTLSNINSQLVVGQETQQDTYEVNAGNITLKDLSDPQALFDISLKKNEKEVARLVGRTQQVTETMFKEVILDHDLTFFGNIYPRVHNLVLKDWDELISIQAFPEFDLTSLFEDLEYISKAGWIKIPEDIIKKVQKGDPTGRISSKFDSTDKLSGFSFEMIGADVKWQGRPINRVKVKGSYSPEGTFRIEGAQLGGLFMAAELIKENEEVLIKNFKVKQGKGLRISCDGVYTASTQTCLLNVKEFAADLTQLQAFPKLKSFLAPWHVRGMVKLKGKIKLIPQFDHLDVTGNLRAHINDLEVRGIPIKNTRPIDFAFSSQEGLRIEGVDLKIQRGDQSYYRAHLALKSAKYGVNGNNLRLEGLNFTVSDPCFAQLAQIGRDVFPDLFDDTLTAFLKDFQCEGGLSGSVQMQLSPENTQVRVHMKDGRYLLWGKACDLQKIQMDFNSKKISISANYAMNRRLLNLSVEMDRTASQHGRLIVRDPQDASPDRYSPLAMYWERDLRQGLVITKMEGKIAGLEVNFSKPKEYLGDAHHQFNGYVRLNDGRRLASLLPPEAAEFITKYALFKGYELRGRLALPKAQPSEFNFQGNLIGRKSSVLGCELESLGANIYITPKSLQINQLQVVDKALRLAMPLMTCGCDPNGKWVFSIPKLMFKKFRPSQLQRKNKETGWKKLLIDDGEINNLRGYLAHPASYTGTGRLYFENLPKKNFLERTLLLLPAEIIGRIGLNTNVLEPAMGTIHFSINHRRIYLNKLEDVYSEGKRSRFYLAKGSNAFVDFDENLHVNVRTKQYNLLFKLAELGELSVRGTIDNPSYAFQKRMSPPPKPPAPYSYK